MDDLAFERAGLIVLERGWLSSNNILFPGDANNGSVIVDSGYAAHAEQTVQLVRNVLGTRPLRRVVNTHLHSDHCGGNSALQAAFDCSIDIPRGEADKVDGWSEDRLTYRATGQNCLRFVRTGLLADGDVVRLGRFDWQAIGTPGHDEESLAFYQPDLQILISADALWENGFGVIFDELEGIPAFDKVSDTLARLSALKAQWIIPGHGRPFKGLDQAIGRAYERLDAFKSNPKRHACYAAKVLIKFRLLELQTVNLAEFRSWLESTSYLRITYDTHFNETPFQAWLQSLLTELQESGAVILDGSLLRNV